MIFGAIGGIKIALTSAAFQFIIFQMFHCRRMMK
jgi:hypothetical protein